MPSIAHNHPSSSVTVSYPMREAQQTITLAELQLIRNLDHQKVTAIKFIRAQYNLGLYEAKMIVDTIQDQVRQPL